MMAPTSKKKVRKPSKVVKPQKSAKKSTIAAKNHRFKPFSERIANLKIDPVRRRRNPENEDERREDTSTYFGRSLADWKDLNLSSTFSAFAKEAAPICDGLPMVLHNEEKLMDLLATYIERGDGSALEPLLSLLSHLAHDLDSRFEKYFQRAVSTITAVAAKHSDPAVVEWSFNCLAWLFKYLSRLLVPDLRPLYNLMAPYLGKELQKPFIIRFAAESLSFLVRKAATRYEKDQIPLEIFLSHLFEESQCETNASTRDLYQQGIMTLLTESMKGVQAGLHSSGLVILQCILEQVERQSGAACEAPLEIVTGTLTSLIHHTDSETFRPIQGTIMKHLEDFAAPLSPHQVTISTRLIFTVAAVRKGTRVSDWASLVSFLQRLVQREEYALDLSQWSVLSAVAVVFQTAPVATVLPALDTFETLRSGPWTERFLQFCDLFARLGGERFQDFLLPQFRKFLVTQCEGRQDDIFLQLSMLVPQGEGRKLTCADNLQYEIVHRVSDVTKASDGHVLPRIASANIALTALPHLKLDFKVWEELQSELLSLLKQSLERSDGGSAEIHDFALGSCLASMLNDADISRFTPEFWCNLCTESPRFLRMEKFWQNLLEYIKLAPLSQIPLEGSHMEILNASLVQCLAMPSNAIRKSALGIIKSIYAMRGERVPYVLDAAIAVETTSVSFATSRSISMNIRRLASGYSDLGSDEFLLEAIPTYCFGILHFQLSQAWDDSINALAAMSKSTVGEQVIISLAQLWLEQTPPGPAENDTEELPPLMNAESNAFQVASDFECSSLAKISAICQQVFEEPRSGHSSEIDQFQSDHARIPSMIPTARGQALKVLNKIPHIAEKRSRMLVPVLLRWAGNVDAEDDENKDVVSPRWSRKDQKAMLSIFAQFTNPRVLFKSEEVYGALLNLCANGDVDIQRAALKAIFSWKDSAVNRYKEHLTNLLDEARFREEISVFLQHTGEGDENVLRSTDHSRVMPVLLRLLFGKAVASSKSGQGVRRKAIFTALSYYGEDVLGMFLDIALEPVSKTELSEDSKLNERSFSELKTPLRQQLGILNMLDDMLERLGFRLETFGVQLSKAVLLCSASASRRLERSEEHSDMDDVSLLRSIRQSGISCLVKVFLAFQDLDLSVYARVAVNELIVPRLPKFATENTESVSGMLQLIASWAYSPSRQRYLTDFHEDILEAVAMLLRNPNAKDEVRLVILQDVADKFLAHGEMRLKSSHISSFVQSIGYVLTLAPPKTVLDACVASFSLLSVHINNEKQAEEVINICSRLLTSPAKVVSNPTKTDLLKTILPLIDMCDEGLSLPLYNALCGLFSRFQDQQSRALLSSVLVKICQSDKELLEGAEICQDLNAVGNKLDQPDHKRRESGFVKIYEHYDQFSFEQWTGIVHNCLFYIRDEDDLVNRTSASRALERFIDAASRATKDFKPLLSSAVLPGIIRGMKSPSELVRAEYLHLLGHLVTRFPDWAAVKDMECLTAKGDEEASFFTNVLHIQHHRRVRALRRLSEDATNLGSSNATKLFIPLLEHFVFEPAEGDAGRALADQAIQTLGALSCALNWPAFRATFKRYVSLLGSEIHEKFALRLLGVLVDALVKLDTVHPGDQELVVSTASNGTSDAREETTQSDLQSRKSDIVIREILSPLMAYLHHKDESTVDRRMPVAITVVKVLQALPDSEMSARLPPVLTDVCHVLRSRSQEARDQTRKTLCQIVALIGPSYFGFVLRELRGALQRGYQLHVLSFTVHSLLVNPAESYQPGDLDSCLPELMSIVMDDIFGVTGQEKDAEEYKSGMKEVKSSKSFDTMELLARVTPVQQFGRLIQPLQALLCQKLDTKTVQKLDGLLTRLRKGIDQNPAANSRDILIFCHEIIRQVYTDTAGTQLDLLRKPGNLSRSEMPSKTKEKGSQSSQTFRIVSFALNLLRKVLRRHEDLMIPTNLVGFLPIAGDALVQGQEEVQISALKLLSAIMKVSLADLETNAPVYAQAAVGLIKVASNMSTDAAKASLELITSIMREKPSTQIKDKDLADILTALKGDLNQPDRQGIIYKFLRAMLGRKIMITELYDIMDEVGKVAVTNPDRTVRESARGAYLQFVLEYPQSKGRWKNQSEMLAMNLGYEYPEGRQSVMELLYQLLPKIPNEMFAKLEMNLFVRLVPTQATDTDSSCRDMARFLITQIFERANDEQISAHLELMDKWLRYTRKPSVQVAALQCWTILLRAKLLSLKRTEGLRDEIDSLIDTDSRLDPSLENAVIENALQTFAALVEVAPDVAFAGGSGCIWNRMDKLLLSESATKLLGLYFTHLASTSSKAGIGLSALPLKGSSGLELSSDYMHQLVYSSLRLFFSTSENLTEALVSQTVRNLVFLGRCFAANGMKRQRNELEGSEESTELGYLFNRLSYIIRQENIHTISRRAAVDCEAALVSAISTIPNIETVLRPLYSLTDPAIPQSDTTLVDKARELLDLLQSKVGKDAYIKIIGTVRTEAKERREDRRAKRRIAAVSVPMKRRKVR